jgi:beta-glucanase (GH16 family)
MRTRAPILALALLLALAPTAPSHAAITWNLSFTDDFNGTKINETNWSVYGKNGPKGSHCWWDQNVTVSGGKATPQGGAQLAVRRLLGRGMCACPVATQLYGKFEVG